MGMGDFDHYDAQLYVASFDRAAKEFEFDREIDAETKKKEVQELINGTIERMNSSGNSAWIAKSLVIQLQGYQNGLRHFLRQPIHDTIRIGGGYHGSDES